MSLVGNFLPLGWLGRVYLPLEGDSVASSLEVAEAELVDNPARLPHGFHWITNRRTIQLGRARDVVHPYRNISSNTTLLFDESRHTATV